MKWYEVEPTALEKHRMAIAKARVRYERDILLGVIMALCFVTGLIVGRII